MIRHHVISLLCLVAVGITGIEAAASFVEEGNRSWKPWLMCILCLGAFLLYLRARKLRKHSIKP